MTTVSASGRRWTLQPDEVQVLEVIRGSPGIKTGDILVAVQNMSLKVLGRILVGLRRRKLIKSPNLLRSGSTGQAKWYAR